MKTITIEENDIISRSDFAALIGITPAAVTTAVKQGRLMSINGKINKKDPTNKLFVENLNARREKRKILSDTEHTKKIAELELRKQEAQTTKIELEVRREINQLISKKIVENFIMSIGKNVRELLLPLGIRLAPLMAGIFGDTDPEKINEARLQIEKEISRAIETIILTTEQEISNNENEDTGEF